jgi:hypothetical protein
MQEILMAIPCRLPGDTFNGAAAGLILSARAFTGPNEYIAQPFEADKFAPTEGCRYAGASYPANWTD